MTSSPASFTITTDTPPSITLGGIETSAGHWTLSGTVSDANPAGLTVNFGGALSGQTAITDANGNYSLATTISGPATVSATVTDGLGQPSNEADFTITADTPSITLSGTETSAGHWTLSGTVTDAFGSAGLTVNFGGALSGQTATTDANGNYSLATTISGPATVSATVTDGLTLTSSPASFTITTDTPPSITLGGTETSAGHWTLSGTVSDANPANLTVNFGGALSGQTATTDANGNYSLSTTISGPATVSATVTDGLGQPSNEADFAITADTPPSITLSGIETSAGHWTLSGTVSDANPANLTVNFGGALSGQTATTDSYGNYSLATTISGPATVSATVTDGLGLPSNEADFAITADTPPSITLSGTETSAGHWTLSGTVSDANPANLTVNFGGALSGQTATTDSYGNYSLATTISGPATVSATVTDGLGLTQ